tara:strand:+ start:618 stop:1493 length:876 start_codon:yes stop_codon:yes gene_type:complete
MSYNIDQFSKITGINKLLLRTWENRYNFLTPQRTNTKIRIYSDELLIQGLNAKILLENGYKISVISKKNNKEIEKLITSLNEKNTDFYNDYLINQFIKSALKYNTTLFNETFDECISKFSIILFYKKIMLPTFSKVGLFWLSNKINPAQEHFLSEMFKQKIYSQIDSITKNPKKNTWLLFLPPNEHHEIGLLFSRFVLLYHSYNVIYLGSNVPLSSLSQVAQTKRIDNILFFSVSNFSKKNLDLTISSLNKDFKKSNVYVASKIDFDKSNKLIDKINLVKDVDNFIKIISK